MKNRIGRKLSPLKLPLAIFAAAVCLAFPRTGGPSLVPAASAQGVFGRASDYDGDDGGRISLAVRGFLKDHGTLFFAAVPAAMFILYLLIMGPADVWDSYSRVRRGRYGGFGSDGGFGGRPGF